MPSDVRRAMIKGARRSAEAARPPRAADPRMAIRAFALRHRALLIGLGLFLLLDLVVALGVAGSAGHF